MLHNNVVYLVKWFCNLVLSLETKNGTVMRIEIAIREHITRKQRENVKNYLNFMFSNTVILIVRKSFKILVKLLYLH